MFSKATLVKISATGPKTLKLSALGLISGALLLLVLLALPTLSAAAPQSTGDTSPRATRLRHRLETALDHWCRWLAKNVEPIPGTDLYTFHPTLGGYRAVAGNQFAAAAGGVLVGAE